MLHFPQIYRDNFREFSIITPPYFSCLPRWAGEGWPDSRRAPESLLGQPHTLERRNQGIYPHSKRPPKQGGWRANHHPPYLATYELVSMRTKPLARLIFMPQRWYSL